MRPGHLAEDGDAADGAEHADGLEAGLDGGGGGGGGGGGEGRGDEGGVEPVPGVGGEGPAPADEGVEGELGDEEGEEGELEVGGEGAGAAVVVCLPGCAGVLRVDDCEDEALPAGGALDIWGTVRTGALALTIDIMRTTSDWDGKDS